MKRVQSYVHDDIEHYQVFDYKESSFIDSEFRRCHLLKNESG